METNVIDEGDDRRYRIEVPNILDDSDLSVYAFRLYAHLKRRAGDTGKCYEGVRPMAEHCKMSPASVVNAKKELEEKGLIKITPGDQKKSIPDTIRIVNIWSKNLSHYQTPCSPNEQGCAIDEQPVHEPAPTRSPNEQPVHVAAQKKEPNKKEQKKERTGESAAGAATAPQNGFTVLSYLQYLKTLKAFDHIDPDREESLIRLWHDKPHNRGRKLTKKFLENWAKKVERNESVTLASTAKARAAPYVCNLCYGDGHVERWNQQTKQDERIPCKCQQNTTTRPPQKPATTLSQSAR